MVQATERPTTKFSQSVDLVEILEREVYPRLSPEQVYSWAGHNFKRSGNRLRGNPPWGQSKSGTSFTAFDDLGFLDSHNGNESGDPVKYLYSLKTGGYAYPKGKDWIETVKELFNLAGVTFPEREWTPQQIKHAQRRSARQAILKAVETYCADILWTARGEASRKHLIEDRGFTPQGLRDFGIGLYPTVKEIKEVLQAKKLDIKLAQQIGVLANKWEGYMTFPWASSYNQPLTLYGHQSKAWAEATGKPKKYALFNPKDDQGAWLHTKESPYLLNRAIRERHKELVLVEGITDAAIAHQQGDTRVIACVAAQLSKQQCETLKRHRIERVIIALDPDAAGDAGIDSCIKSLSGVGINAYVISKLPCGLDPDEYILEYGIDTWQALTKAAIHGYRWKAQQILARGDLSTDTGKDAVLERAIAYVRSQEDKLSLKLHFVPTLAVGLGMDIEELREALERQLNGNGGGGDSNGGDDCWDDGSGKGGNNWNTPVTFNGEIGWLVFEGEEDPVPQFYPKCNFDFVVERELESEDGGGVVLQVKRSLDRVQKRVIINSVDYGSVKTFEKALKQALGSGIVVNLKDEHLKALIHVRLREYRERGGKLYRLIDRYGQQVDGVWVFRDRQFKPDGTSTNEEESGWVFNPALGKEDFIPCPELAPEDPEALKRLVDACRVFFGEKNIHQVLMTMGWVIAGIHSQAIFRHDNCFPLINPNGEPGACKTLAAEAALSLVGKNWAQMGMLARVSTSALYEHGARTAGLPFMMDDPERSNELDEIFKTWYNWKPRRVRGNDQQPKSPLGAITNHVVGADQAATFTRFIRLTYERTSGGSKLAFQQLRYAQESASGAFPLLLKMGYNPDSIAAIERDLLPYLPLAHARIAQSLAIALYYADKLLELTGYSDSYNIKQWVVENCCKSENDADNSADSLQDFISKLLSLESESFVGSWNFKRNIDRSGKSYVALFAADVWSLVDKKFTPATYNFKSLKPLVLKAGGVVDITVRFDRDRDSVLAYERAKITTQDTQGDSELNPPETQPRKAWLIPSNFFEGNDPPVTGVTGCNWNPVTPSTDEFSRVTDPASVPCNCVTEKIDIDIEERAGKSSNSGEEVSCETPENPSYTSYTVTDSPETLTEQGLQPVTEITENPVTPENPSYTSYTITDSPETLTEQGLQVEFTEKTQVSFGNLLVDGPRQIIPILKPSRSNQQKAATAAAATPVAVATAAATARTSEASETRAGVSEITQNFQIGDRVWHPVFGAGTVYAVVDDMVFGIFDAVRNSAGYIDRETRRSPYAHELTRLDS